MQLGLQLVDGALVGRLVRPPAQEAGAVTEAAAGDLVVADLGDQPGLERLPLGRARGRPAARPARRVAGEPWTADQFLQLCGQRRAVLGRDRGSKADVM